MFGSSRVLFGVLLALGPDGLALVQDGGAVYVHQGSFTADSCTFEGNSASDVSVPLLLCRV